MADDVCTLFLAGDVMTGRGVDQILATPSHPALHEPFVTDAREYVRLAERVSGPVPAGARPEYVWGDALAEWMRVSPADRIVNLETSITRSETYDRGKGIHYRMHPANVACLSAAGIGVCVLANNHVLDFGRDGLVETLDVLARAGIQTAGAGRDAEEAMRPVVRRLEGGVRLVIGACAHASSGVPDGWAARPGRPGVHLLADLSAATAAAVASIVAHGKRPGDAAILSVHWGDNWGYEVPPAHVEFAHRLVDAGIDVVYGHSSHHVRPIEIYRGRLILYGCGDFVDDYEGIGGYEQYRGDLVLMFFPAIRAATGALQSLEMVPLRMRRMRLGRAPDEDARWICRTVNAISRPFGTAVALEGGRLRWCGRPPGALTAGAGVTDHPP